MNSAQIKTPSIKIKEKAQILKHGAKLDALSLGSVSRENDQLSVHQSSLVVDASLKT